MPNTPVTENHAGCTCFTYSLLSSSDHLVTACLSASRAGFAMYENQTDTISVIGKQGTSNTFMVVLPVAS